jgi:hypothetical protein
VSSSAVHAESRERVYTRVSNFDFDFAHNPIPAAPWRQSQISLGRVGWEVTFDSQLGDFIDSKPVASPSDAVLGPLKLEAACAAATFYAELCHISEPSPKADQSLVA